MLKSSIILVGLSYTGKSSVGQLIARRLGWPFKDTDDIVVRLAEGKPISEIFYKWGEERFRGIERQALGLACSETHAVISTGGGAVLDSGNRAMMSGSGVVFWLDAQPRVLIQRRAAGPGEDRPNVSGDHPLGRMETMKRERLPAYAAAADWTIATDTLSVDEVADEVLRNYGRLRGRLRGEAAEVPSLEGQGDEPGVHASALPPAGTGAAAVVSTGNGAYPVFVGANALNTLPARLRNLGFKGKTYLVTDENVARHYGERVEDLLREGDFSVSTCIIPAGETHKELDTVVRIYDWLTERRAERGHVIVALGGGVTGDMAGFAAATYLRGMPYVQVPTTLLAMVDASIGGKTGVNRPAAKNLVGSFYQPRMVLADVEVLRTLGERELTEGWAEVVKHAFIRDLRLLEVMEQRVEQLKRLEPPFTAQVIAASAAIKAEVVSQDERESGVRAHLNYGHTIGHAIEAATGYDAYFHGEAVAIGMMGAGRLSQEMGLLSADELERQRRLIQAFGLPLRCPGVSTDAIREAMGWDKKVVGARQRWVLLDGLGRAMVRDDVPQQAVDAVLEELTSA